MMSDNNLITNEFKEKGDVKPIAPEYEDAGKSKLKVSQIFFKIKYVESKLEQLSTL